MSRERSGSEVVGVMMDKPEIKMKDVEAEADGAGAEEGRSRDRE